jgi:hypothetical protein
MVAIALSPSGEKEERWQDVPDGSHRTLVGVTVNLPFP